MMEGASLWRLYNMVVRFVALQSSKGPRQGAIRVWIHGSRRSVFLQIHMRAGCLVESHEEAEKSNADVEVPADAAKKCKGASSNCNVFLRTYDTLFRYTLSTTIPSD